MKDGFQGFINRRFKCDTEEVVVKSACTFVFLFIISMLVLFFVTLVEIDRRNAHGIVKRANCGVKSTVPLNRTCCNIEDGCKYLPEDSCQYMSSCNYLVESGREGDCCLNEVCIEKTKHITSTGMKNCTVVCDLCYDLKLNILYWADDDTSPGGIRFDESDTKYRWSNIILDCGRDKNCLDRLIEKYTVDIPHDKTKFFDCYYYEDNPYNVTLTSYSFSPFNVYAPTIFLFMITGIALLVAVCGTIFLFCKKRIDNYAPIN